MPRDASPKFSLPNTRVILFAITMLLVIVGYVAYETSVEYAKQASHQMEAEATRIDRELIIEIEHSSNLVQAIGQEIARMDPDDLKGIAVLLRTFDTTATVHHVFSWIDANGNNVVSTNKGVHPAVDVSDRDFVKKATATPWKVVVDNPIQGRVSGKWALPVAVGVTDATGKYIGTVLISMDIYTITSNLQQVVKDENSFFIVYSSNGITPLTQTASEELKRLDAYSDHLRHVNLYQQPSGMLARANLLDKDSMFVYYESSVYPYIILLGIPNAPVLFLKLLTPRIIETLAVGLLIILLLWVIRLRVIEPVVELSDVIAGMMRGEAYHAPVSKSSVTELYQLEGQVKKLDDYLREIRLIEEENKNKNTMLKNSKRLLELGNNIKMGFLKSMSHELRTPLNSIIGFSEIMKNKDPSKLDNMSYQQYASNIHRAAKQLQALINDIQQMATLDSHSAELQEKNIDIRFILSKVLRAMAPKFAENKINVELKLPEFMPHLKMDEKRLEQIITGIIAYVTTGATISSHMVIRAYPEQEKGDAGFCISFTTTRQAAESDEEKSAKHDLEYIGIPLTRALAEMYQVEFESRPGSGKSNVSILRFPKERLVPA